MKLVITQSNLTLKGGAEAVLLKIAQRYKAKIYTAEYDPKGTFEGFRDLDVEVIGRSGLYRVLPYSRMAQGLNYGLSFLNLKLKEDYDVINPHMAPSHWVRKNNPRVVWYCHTPLRDVYDLYDFRLSLKKFYARPVYRIGAYNVRKIDRSVVKDIEFIFANSRNTKSRVKRYLDRDSEVLGGGIDYRRYSDDGDGKYFLYPSRFSPNKRQEYALKAFEMFKRMKKGYRLLLVGPVSKDRFYYDYYQRIADEAKAIGDVKIITEADTDALIGLYSKATAVLYTPINEDYGLVPLEAMASGKPIISVNEGGPKETIMDGSTGFLVNSAREMAERMRHVAEHPKLSEQMGRRGAERVRKNYSWDRFFARFDQVLRKVKQM
ncbi:MAG: glycosyltransferase [Candidatus Micrarchaeota archaeon]|nr:glycosyltransferase [Candidatus Micrarchaeota archaeon]